MVVVGLEIGWQEGLDDPRVATLRRLLARDGWVGGDRISVKVSDIVWFGWNIDTVSDNPDTAKRLALELAQKLLLGRGRILFDIVSETNLSVGTQESDAATSGGGDGAPPLFSLLRAMGHPPIPRDFCAAAVSAKGVYSVAITLKPGVTDTAAETLRDKAMEHAVSGKAPTRVAFGRRWCFATGPDLAHTLDAADIATIAARFLANPVIETVVYDRWPPAPFLASAPTAPPPELFPVRALDHDALVALSASRRLALNLDEMSTIRHHYENLGRDPTDVELETFAQTWSEHCVHKTFRARITSEETDATGATHETVIHGLFDTFIRAPTETLGLPWVHSAFEDNAGVIALTPDLDVAVKVETHNRPSALDPFGGAHTGVGGVIRDIIGVSARPCANIDVLCFGPSAMAHSDLPAGVIHPRRVREGVVEGVADYGNKLGIPTVAGAIVHDPGYVANPLVFVGCIGVVPRGRHRRVPGVGDRLVVVGGLTGRDGLKGATFSSAGLDGHSQVVSGGAVQIGDPIMEKRVLDLVLAARDEGLYHALTDCGAGGLSSAVGEMAHQLGADVELAHVPLKYPGLGAWEIWLSEAQERMVLAVPEAHVARLQALGAETGCPVATIGTLGGQRLVVRHNNVIVGDFALDFLHHGRPERHLRATWSARDTKVSGPDRGPVQGASPGAHLLKLLGDENGCSVAETLQRYDRTVQGGSLGGALVGRTLTGPGDGSVLRPLELQGVNDAPAIVIGIGVKAALAGIDPYDMAWQAVDEAIRNAVAVGANPGRIALLDNFAWGNPDLPDRLGGLVRACRGCRDAALRYGTPFVSGKDSLYNEWTDRDGTRRPIPGTLMVTAIGVLPGGVAPVAAIFGTLGDVIFAAGDWSSIDSRLPSEPIPEIYQKLHEAIVSGIVTGCHDVSRGGLAVAAAEMTFGEGLGARIDIAGLFPGDNVLHHDRLFAEGPGRFLVTTRPADADRFIDGFGPLGNDSDGDVPVRRLGVVTGEPTLVVTNGGVEVMAVAVADLLRCFTGTAAD